MRPSQEVTRLDTTTLLYHKVANFFSNSRVFLLYYTWLVIETANGNVLHLWHDESRSKTRLLVCDGTPFEKDFAVASTG